VHPAHDPGDLGPLPQESDFFNQSYNIGGRNVTLGQLEGILNQTRPTYDNDYVCVTGSNGACCPDYCCSLTSVVEDLNMPLNHSVLQQQTAQLTNGVFTIISRSDPYTTGLFAAVLSHDFDKPIHGGGCFVEDTGVSIQAEPRPHHLIG
jgi:hypothetical protein